MSVAVDLIYEEVRQGRRRGAVRRHVPAVEFERLHETIVLMGVAGAQALPPMSDSSNSAAVPAATFNA